MTRRALGTAALAAWTLLLWGCGADTDRATLSDTSEVASADTAQPEADTEALADTDVDPVLSDTAVAQDDGDAKDDGAGADGDAQDDGDVADATEPDDTDVADTAAEPDAAVTPPLPEEPVVTPWDGGGPDAAPIITWLGTLSHPDMESPHRIATSPSGRIAVTDPRRHAVHLFGQNGALQYSLVGIDEPLGCAFDTFGALFVGDGASGTVRRYGADGTLLDELQPDVPFGRPGELAWDPDAELLYVVDGGHDTVGAFAPDGLWLFDLAAPADDGGVWTFPTGLAVAPGGERVYAVDHDRASVRVYDADGVWQASFGGYGADPGELTRAQGVAVDPSGRVYVADAFQGRLQVFSPTGAHLGYAGDFGDAPEQLWLPSDATFDPYHRLLVTSYRTAAVVIYDVDGQSVTPPGAEASP